MIIKEINYTQNENENETPVHNKFWDVSRQEIFYC